MFDLLRAHILKRIKLTEVEFTDCLRFFTPKKIRKRHFLLHEGDICKSLAFVTRGCLRCYSVGEDGDEHVVQFAMEDWWISDLQSFLSGTPAIYNIDALEDAELLLIDHASRAELLETFPKFERFFRILLETNYVANQNRIADVIGASAEQRYLRLLRTYPGIVRRVPLRQIASYLGIAPESLSRIRRRLSERR